MTDRQKYSGQRFNVYLINVENLRVWFHPKSRRSQQYSFLRWRKA